MRMATITWWGHDGESNGWSVIVDLGATYIDVVERGIGRTVIVYEANHIPRSSGVHTDFAVVRFS